MKPLVAANATMPSTMNRAATMIARRKWAAGRKGADFRNILSGIAKCAACGGSMTYVGKGDTERYLACSSARRRRGCDCRALFNFNEAERQFLDAALTFDPAMRLTSTAPRTREELHRVQRDVARLSDRLRGLLESFGSDSTEEIVAAVSAARDQLQQARLEEVRLREKLVVEEHGAGLVEVHAAVRDLKRQGKCAPQAAIFAARARVAHAAKAAGSVAICSKEERQIELRCLGYSEVVRFTCSPQRPLPARDRRGRFALA